MRKKPIPIEYVRKLIGYDPTSGILTWLESKGRAIVGQVAGAKQTSRGKTYIQVKIDRSYYKGHQLAWVLYYGIWPMFDLDHIDGDGTNNRVDNLRPCSMAQNKANSRRYKNNKSGHKGVFWKKDSKNWSVSIQKNGVRRHLGRFSSYDDAVAAYTNEAKALYGEFARAE